MNNIIKKCKNCGKEIDWGEFAPEKELNTGLCSICMNAGFNLTCISRADLLESFSAEEIGKLDDDDMVIIVDKMNNAYLDSIYWEDLKTCTEIVLENK